MISSLDIWHYQEVVEIQYESISGFNNGFAIVRKSGKEGMIDMTGKHILSLEYENIDFTNDWFMPTTDGRYYFVVHRDSESKNIESLFEKHGELYNELAIARNGKMYFVIDKKGKIIGEYQAE
ncbi:MAG: WG repeat-containing protein [Saprospiraceae bacterium]|nr:WG repeat-containing protein [Saprospiraceae bacterium]